MFTKGKIGWGTAGETSGCAGENGRVCEGETGGVHRDKRASLIGDGFCQWLVVVD